MDTTRDNIKANIIKFRKQSGLSQKQLADKLNVKSSRVSNWEQGENAPDIEMINQIANVLNIQPNELLGWDANEKAIRSELTFYSYLESIGYSLSINYGNITSKHMDDIKFENGDNHSIEVFDDATCEYVLCKDGIKTVFTDDEFIKFEEEIKKSIDYLIWQQNKKRTAP